MYTSPFPGVMLVSSTANIERSLFEWAYTIDHSGGNITGDMRETRPIDYRKLPLRTMRRDLKKDDSMDFAIVGSIPSTRQASFGDSLPFLRKGGATV